MSKEFSLADAIKASAVSNPDTSRRITDIDIDALTDDPNNFYELSGLDELAANIETVGLQQPLLVRPAAEEGQYIIVSGHRRRAAIRKLVDDGREDLRSIPCIVDSWEGSEAMRELRLIYANADTRRMTSAEISKQAERVEALLYQLQEEGWSFPGRMRDHVAEACKVSRTKLARLKVIRERLIPEAAAYWERGEWSEAAAYRLAQEDEDIQRLAWDLDIGKDAEKGNISYNTEFVVGNTIGKIKSILERQCHHPKGCGVCKHQQDRLEKLFTANGYAGCEYYCCHDCPDLTMCESACPKTAVKVSELKKQARQERAQQKQSEQEAEAARVALIKPIWDRFGKARAAAGKSVRECWQAMKIGYYGIDAKDYPKYESGRAKFTSQTNLPFGYNVRLVEVSVLTGIADALCCSVDYLLGRDVPMAPEGFEGQAVISGWRPGSTNPGAIKGDVVAVFDMGDGNPPFRSICWWDGEDYCIGRGGAPIHERCVRWMRLPPEPEEVQDDER